MNEPAAKLQGAIERAAPLLRKIDDAAASRRPAPGKWSQKEILGHLIDSAANNHQRFVRAQLQTDLRFPGYEQDGWVRVQDHADAPWRGLVELWLHYNLHLARIAGKIPPERLGIRCRIGEGEETTLGLLIEDYVRHLEHHLRQLLPDFSA